MPTDIDVISVMLIFCRIGACLMVVPGLSSARVPARVRLFLALVVAVVAAPIVQPVAAAPPRSSAVLAQWIFAECLAGWWLGFISRVMIEAIEFAASAMSSYIGLTGLAVSIEGDGTESALATLARFTATLLFIQLGLPQYLLVSVIHSFDSLPVGSIAEGGAILSGFTRLLGVAFHLGLQVSAPFLIYAILLNGMFALLGKIIPQIQTYFLSVPFLALGGLFLLYFLLPEMLSIFVSRASQEITVR